MQIGFQNYVSRSGAAKFKCSTVFYVNHMDHHPKTPSTIKPQIDRPVYQGPTSRCRRSCRAPLEGDAASAACRAWDLCGNSMGLMWEFYGIYVICSFMTKSFFSSGSNGSLKSLSDLMWELLARQESCLRWSRPISILHDVIDVFRARPHDVVLVIFFASKPILCWLVV